MPAEHLSDSSPGQDENALDPSIAKIDRYKVIKELGRGGFGVVYLAEQKSTGQRCALKMLLPERMGIDESMRQEQLDRFTREMKLIAKLTDAVVDVYGEGLRDLLTPAQVKTLDSIQLLGWQLKFVRRPLFQDPTPVVSNATNDQIGMLDPDGRINIDIEVEVRTDLEAMKKQKQATDTC